MPRLNLGHLTDLCLRKLVFHIPMINPGPVKISTEAENREVPSATFLPTFFLSVRSVVSSALLPGCGGSCGWCELVTAQTSTNLTGNMRTSATENKSERRRGKTAQHSTAQTPSNRTLNPNTSIRISHSEVLSRTYIGCFYVSCSKLLEPESRRCNDIKPHQ